MKARVKQVKHSFLTLTLLIISLAFFIGQPSIVAAAGTPPATSTPFALRFPANLKVNKAGYQATGPLHTFLAGQMTFTVPTFTTPNTFMVTRLDLGGDPQIATSVNLSAGIKSSTNATGVQTNSAWWMAGSTEKEIPIPFQFGIHAKDTISLSLTSNLKSNTDSVLITNSTTKESHPDQLIGQQYIIDGLIGQCLLFRPTIAVPNPTAGQLSQTEELATLPDFGTETFSKCSFSNGVSPLSPVAKLANVLKLDMITQIAPPTAQDPTHLIMTIGTATTPDTKGLGFAIKQITKQQLLSFP